MTIDMPASLGDYIQSSSIALTVSDAADPDLPLAVANDAFARLTGFSREEAVGRNCRFLQRDRREQRGVQRIREFLAAEEGRQVRVNIVNFRKDGTPFVNLLTLSRICTSSGRTCYLFASQFDIGSASESEAEEYDRALGGITERLDRTLDPHRLQLVGSYTALADAASAIVEARMMIDDIDKQARLY